MSLAHNAFEDPDGSASLKARFSSDAAEHRYCHPDRLLYARREPLAEVNVIRRREVAHEPKSHTGGKRRKFHMAPLPIAGADGRNGR